MGCNFCTTSAFFGGKGKIVESLLHGRGVIRLMEEAEASRDVKSFFIMDENFLLQKRRAMELLALMKAAARAGRCTFSRRRTPSRKYSYEELVELGISSIWLGLESPQLRIRQAGGRGYAADDRELREHGIVLLGSTILGLEHHTPENIAAGDRTRRGARDRPPPVHALHAGSGHAALSRNGGTGPAARRGPGGYPRPGRLQFPARRDLARGIQASS